MDANGSTVDAWAVAARLLARWLEDHERVDALLEELPASTGRAGRARVQHLLYGTVRHLGRIEAACKPLIQREPRARVRAVLLLAGFELIEGGGDGHVAKVVHHAVEQTKQLASASEAGLVNAVVRKLSAALAEEKPPGRLASAARLADFYSHPAWLVERWLGVFGAVETRALLEWNLRPAPLHARWRAAAEAPPEWLTATPWTGFFEVPSGRWADVEALIAAGKVFLQDPATRHAVDLLDPKPGERVLDACASPGGKSLAIADRMGSGVLAALDLPGERQARLAENLARAPGGMTVHRVEADLRSGRRELAAIAPKGFDAVLLDAPCSNTGVMRHRVDVKWRLLPGDFGRHARQQLALLEAAAWQTAPGGRLVYSTCSLDFEENEGVVEAFLKKQEGRFTKAGEHLSRPWTDGHDGAGAFVLRREG